MEKNLQSTIQQPRDDEEDNIHEATKTNRRRRSDDDKATKNYFDVCIDVPPEKRFKQEERK